MLQVVTVNGVNKDLSVTSSTLCGVNKVLSVTSRYVI